MTDNPIVTMALDEYDVLTTELGDLHRQLAMVRVAERNSYHSAYASSVAAGHNVTTCRELADSASATYTNEAETINAELQAGLLRLRYLDQHLAFIHVM